MAYSDKQIAFIQSMTDDGAKADKIASAYTKTFGVPLTRNAVIGLWNRGRITRAPAQVRVKRLNQVKQPRPANKGHTTLPPSARKAPLRDASTWAGPKAGARPGVPFEELRDESFTQPGMCRYPLAGFYEVARFFCGRVTVSGGVWCEQHRRDVYRKYANAEHEDVE